MLKFHLRMAFNQKIYAVAKVSSKFKGHINQIFNFNTTLEF